MDWAGCGPGSFLARVGRTLREFRVRLRKKVLSAAPAQQAMGTRMSLGKQREDKKVQLIEVWLVTSGGKGID